MNSEDTQPEPFSLPLKPFEELFFHQDQSPNWPATITIRFRIEGDVDLESATLAIQSASLRHPLLCSKLKQTSGGKLSWESGPCRPRVYGPLSDHSSQDENRDKAFMEPFDLGKESPLRIQLVPDNGHTIVSFYAHHSAMDGLGTLQVASDWLGEIAKLTNSESPRRPARKVDASLLMHRCSANHTWRERLKLARLHWLGLLGFVNFFRNTAIPLKPLAKAIGKEQRQGFVPAVEVAKLSQEDTKRLKIRAKKLSVTVNDMMIVEVFRAIKDWQDASNRPSGSHLRISIPVNERTVRHRRLPGCNHCTIINLDRSPDQLAVEYGSSDYEKLVSGVSFEMRTIRDWKLGMWFWGSLRLIKHLPSGLKRPATTQRCESTCLLTNLGELEKRIRLPVRNGQLVCGDFPLSDFELIAPLRYGTAAAISLFYYQRQLHVLFHRDPSTISSANANELLDRLLSQLS